MSSKKLKMWIEIKNSIERLEDNTEEISQEAEQKD